MYYYYLYVEISPSYCTQTEPSSGISFKLSYIPRSGQDFYRDFFKLPFDTPQCPLDVFISLNSSKDMNGLSFYSSCLELVFDSLLFADLSNKFYIPMINETHCIQSNDFNERFPTPFGLIVHSYSNMPYLRLNNYIILQSGNDNISVSFGFSKYTKEKVGLLYSVNITLLDGTLQVPVTLSNGTIEFSGHVTIFNDNIYRTYLSASGSTQNTWEDLTLRVDGWFPKYENGFVHMIEKCVRDKFRATGEEANNRKVKADEKLSKANSDLEVALRQLNFANEQYSNASLRLNRTKANLERAKIRLMVAENTVDNATEDLEDAEDAIDNVCELRVCPMECQNATRKRTVYEDVYIEVTGRCTGQHNVKVTVRVPPYYAIIYQWRYVYCCWRHYYICFFFVCITGRCSSVCKYVPVYEPVVNVKEIIVQEPYTYFCTIRRYDRSIERTEDYMDPCGRMIPNPVCVAMNRECTANRELALKLIEKKQSELVRPLRERNEAKAAVDVAEIRVNQAEAEKNASEDEVRSAETFYMLMKQSQNLTKHNHQIIINSIRDDLMLYNLTQQYNGSQVFDIVNITFSVSVSTNINPVTFPINVIYNVPYHNKQQTLPITYHFKQSFLSQKESLVQGIVDHFLNKSSSRQRRQEDNIPEENFGQNQFEIRCVQLKSITNFLQYLQTSLQTSVARTVELQKSVTDLIEYLKIATNSTTVAPLSFNGNFTNLEFLFDITQDEIDEGQREPLDIELVDDTILSFVGDTYAELKSRAETVLLNVNRTVLSQWRTQIDLLLQSDGSIADRQCLGLLDCIVVLNGSLESLLAFAPSTVSDSLLQSLPLASEFFTELATNENLAISEAIEKLSPIIMIVNNMNNNGYWCSTPPEILVHPIAKTSIKINYRLMLACEGNSSLPVTYQWRKEGVVIPNANNNTLVINNMQISDEGNYICEVTNDVKSVQSTNASVHVFVLPEFFQVPESVVTYIGDINGAYFTCNATARPDPGWRWYHRASEHEEWKEIIGEETNELLIRSPDKTNEGQYICLGYNDHGNISSDPISLRVVSVTAKVLSYTIVLSMNLINSTSNVTNMTEVETVLIAQTEVDNFETDLINQIKESVDIGNVTISGISSSTNGNILLVSFELVSTNVTVKDTGKAPLQNIALNLLASKEELDRVRDNFRSFIESEGLELEYNGQDYEYINESFTVKIPEIQCPAGQQLHSNTFLCSM